MAPNDERSGGDHHSHEEDNPFIAFRRYADEQMASLLHSFIGLPSAFSSPNMNSRWRPYDDEARRRARDNWYTSAQNDEGKSGWRPEAGRDRSTDSVTDSNAYGIPGRKLERPAEDTEAVDAPVCPYRPIEQQPHNLFHPAQCLLPWPVNYMLYSPYSPYHLERDEQTQAYGSRWRDAFEELLDYQGGDADADGRQRSIWGSSLGPLRLHNEGNPISLPDIVKRLLELAPDRSRGHDAWFEELGSRQPEHDAEEDEMTELDLYERLLNRKRFEGNNTLSQATHTPEATKAAGQVGSTQAKESDSLGIISTLTSTERVTLPDGTVQTKVMLKKRFADGREESSETVHTTQGNTHLHGSNSENPDKATKPVEPATTPSDSKEGNPKSERRGWFWS